MTIAVSGNAGPRGRRLGGNRTLELFLSRGLYLALAAVLYDQFAHLRALYLVTGVVSVLSLSSVWLSHLVELGKKANLVQKGGELGAMEVGRRGYLSLLLYLRAQSYALPPCDPQCTW